MITRGRSMPVGLSEIQNDDGESVVLSSVPVDSSHILPDGVTAFHSTSVTPSHISVAAPSQGIGLLPEAKPEAAFMAVKELELRERELELKTKELELERARLEFERVALSQTQSGVFGFQSMHNSAQQTVFSHRTCSTPSGVSLPRLEVQSFDGSPLEYWSFRQSFEDNIASQIAKPATKLAYLVQYCKGEARSVIKGCTGLNPATAYAEAWRRLEDHFGQTHRLVHAVMNDILDGRQLTGDLNSMRSFSNRLKECSSTLAQLGKAADLDHTSNLVKLMCRLPDDLQSEWAKHAGCLRLGGREAKCSDLIDFVEQHIATMDNVFGMAISEANRFHQPRSAVNHHQQSRVSTIVVSAIPSCGWCSRRGHGLGGCKAFSEASLNDRRNFIRKNKRCFVCLNSGHFSTDCKSSIRCTVNQCGGRHHGLLHASPQPEASITKTSANVATGRVRLGFVPVVLKGTNREIVTNALVDNGSDVTLISAKLAKMLQLEGESKVLNIRTLHGSQNTPSRCVTLQLGSTDGEFLVTASNVFTIDSLPCSRVDQPIDLDRWSHLKDVKVETAPHDEVGLLIGCDLPEAHWVLDQRVGKSDEPHAVQTPFGWTVRGNIGMPKGKVGHKTSASSVFYTTIEGMSMEENLERLYESEYKWSKDDDTEALSREDERALTVARRSIRIVEGRYEVGVPWRREVPVLPDNRSMARYRVGLLRKRLLRDGELLRNYIATIKAHETKGYISEVSTSAVAKRWYLPHHPVIHPKKPGKVRIVFDCAAKFQGTSLNDELLNGPNLNNDLTGVLLRFRQGPVAASADIEEMFLRVRLPETDRWAFSFLWWANEDLAGEPEVYQWNVHPFGATSSPFCAAYALRKISQENSFSQSEQWSKAILDNFYVDDCLLAFQSTRSAAEGVVELKDKLAQGGFRLTKWTSNRTEALALLPESERSLASTDKELLASQSHHTLGVVWDVMKDTIGIDLKTITKPVTKRGVLSVVASFFDPMGIVSPLLLPGRNFLQRLCRQGLGWDSQITKADEKWWVDWLGKLTNLPRIEVPRYALYQTDSSVALELHVFSDASGVGYGAVAYVRSQSSDGCGVCNFVLGKSRVIPSKPITIPRLELTAAVLAVKLKNFVERESRLSFQSTFLWTDSELVLRYLNNAKSRFKTFVANRVAFVQNHTTVTQWRYVPTTCNPADLASRGISKAYADELDLWLRGPSFLMGSKSSWPQTKLEIKDISEDVEIKRVAAVMRDTTTQPILNKLLLRYSSWSRLVRGTAWLRRFVQYMLVMHSKNSDSSLKVGRLDLSEIKLAEKKVVQMIQEESFDVELNHATSTPGYRLGRHLSNLKPVFRDGLMCLGGRVSTGLALLPNRHPAVDMLIRNYHLACGHMGSSHVLADIRKKFWIVKGMANVRRVLRGCLFCRSATAQPCGQEMATLPTVRIESGTTPFLACGVDYFGPFEVKYGRVTLKRYGCLFTCLKTRAVHLEIAHFLTTNSFLMALIRFIGRRGVPEAMYSDNGSNFVGAEAELRRQIEELDQSRISNAAIERGIEWHFNPPNASHRGGIWERMIRTTRRVLSAVANQQRLTDESLTTFMVEAERLINNRPITPVLDDPEQPNALTPNDLLLLRSNPGLPSAEVTLAERYTKAWRQAQYLASVFWKRWVREYLPTLQSRSKWHKREREVCVGDLVLIIDGATTYGSWPKGVVAEVLKGHDDCVRDVRIRTANGVVTRDIRSVCLLEAAFDESH